MIGTLVRKDLRRLRVNWRGFLILLALPLGMTALLGAVFGPRARSGGVPRIKVAVVDEDENFLGGMIASAFTSEQSREYFDPVQTEREVALQLIRKNQVSAVVLIPANFSRTFLNGETSPPIELIKNPAQSYLPAITEELVRVITEVLNAVSLNLMGELPELVSIFEDPETSEMAKLSGVVARVGKRFERAEDYLFPPVISYQRSKVETKQQDNAQPGFNIFAFVMPGLVSMFLLFAAEGTTRDLFVEYRQKTLDRYRTYRVSLFPFFLAKAAYTLVVVLLSAVIMLGVGAWIFAIQWTHPFAVSLLTVCYSVFCVGFAYMLLAIIKREQLAATLNTVIIMLMAFLGGAMMPTQNLPPLMRDSLTAWMPNYQFAESIKRLQFDSQGPDWRVACVWLILSGTILLVVAVLRIQRQLARGVAQ